MGDGGPGDHRPPVEGRRGSGQGHGRTRRQGHRRDRRPGARRRGLSPALRNEGRFRGASAKDSLDFLVAGKAKPAFKLPLLLKAEKASVPVGGKARLLLDSGWSGQPVLFETFKGGALWERRWIEAGKDGGIVEIPVAEDMRGGFGVRLTAVRDHQLMSEEALVFVPWDNKELGISFATFRDKLAPGGRETWRVTVKTPEGKPAEKGAAELLAYMYDRSLDIFAPHRPPRLTGLYPYRAGAPAWDSVLGTAMNMLSFENDWRYIPGYPTFRPDSSSRSAATASAGPGRRYAGGVVGGVVGRGRDGRGRHARSSGQPQRPMDEMAKPLSARSRPKAKASPNR